VNGRRYALIAGGGTAGHLQPALAVAEALVEAGHDRSTIGFIGSSRGQDATALEGRGFPFELLPGRGVVRSLSMRSIVQNIGALWGLAVAAVRAQAIVRRARPEVIVAVGGYASMAGALAAVVQRVPLVLVNIDAVPGAANRLFGRWASASAVGWEGTALANATVTGTPVRPAIASVDRSEAAMLSAKRVLGLPEERSVVVVFGGSLGARRINGAVDGLADQWVDRDDVAIYHIVGRRDWGAYATDGSVDRMTRVEGALTLVRVPYEERMDVVYTAADVVVCRAGAMTIAELAAAGVPSVLVPLPGAPGDHQTANARVLERAGGAVLLPDPTCTPDALVDAVGRLLADPALRQSMGAAAGAQGRPDAAAAGARVVESVVTEKSCRGAPGARRD
jgi:undecaprenyldiphospho-muramoylpentapeptide beta-N-acetylglucosaminyltransferase